MKVLIHLGACSFLLFLPGCASETEKRLEQIERQNDETRELYQKKAGEIRKELEDGKATSPAESFQEALKKADSRNGRDQRFDEWLSQAEVIEQTGLSEDEIDEMVLRGKLKAVRRPNLETRYDPESVQDLKGEIGQKP